MPIYEFACRSCDSRFEELVKVNSAAISISCPECGSNDTARLLSMFAVGAPGSGEHDAAPAGAGRAGGCCGGTCGCG